MRVVYNRLAAPGRRVRDLLVLCTACRAPTYERVVRLRWYTIAMPKFMANGGNGYDFRDVPEGHREETGVTDDAVLKKYVKKKTPLFPVVDGRITFVDAAARPCPGVTLVSALAALGRLLAGEQFASSLSF